MSLERIWAGWRAAYIKSVSGTPPVDDAESCVLCRLAAVPDDESLVVHRGEHSFAVMNAYPYTSGHLMAAPLRHEARLDALDSAEAPELMELIQQATTALTDAYSPDGLNVGANLGRSAGAGVPGHVHVHVLPRWSGDTNFVTAIAEARVLPEDLRTSWKKVRAAWPDTSSSSSPSSPSKK